MGITGWYYLHVNGELIYKGGSDSAVDIRDSDLARALWPVDTSDRALAWRTLIEALAAGARKSRVFDLAVKWGCDDTDADEYAKRVGILVDRDGPLWCASRTDFKSLAQSPAGFGKTKLEAFAELAKALGYRPAKMWGPEFHELLKRGASTEVSP